MTQFLITKFIKDSDNINDSKVREKYGTLSSFVGIACNIILFVFKLIVGTIANSISITSDAFNNLSDCATSIITLFGYKMAAKPADKEHPFGHGRMEYILSFILAIIILMVGYELVKNSVKELIDPSKINFSIVSTVVLVFSILLKIWMSRFNNKLGTKLNNSAMLATSKDSLNDVVATSATLFALIVSQFTTLPIDGMMGIVVSIFVLKSGFEIIKSTVDELLGQTPDPETVELIKKLIKEEPLVIGYHDLMVHNYGPGRHFGSAHIEVRSDVDFLVAHDAVDMIEKRVLEETGIMLSLHLDPINMDDEETKYYYDKVKGIVRSIEKETHLHDFRIVTGETHTNLIFDLVVPFNFKLNDDEIIKIINDGLKDEPKKIYIVPTIENKYV